MKPGTKVICTIDNKAGTVRGPIHQFRVWWVLVEWDTGGSACVMEEFLIEA